MIRSTVVVDEDGKVFLAQYNVKATGHVAKLRRDLELNLRTRSPRGAGPTADRWTRTRPEPHWTWETVRARP